MLHWYFQLLAAGLLVGLTVTSSAYAFVVVAPQTLDRTIKIRVRVTPRHDSPSARRTERPSSTGVGTPLLHVSTSSIGSSSARSGPLAMADKSRGGDDDDSAGKKRPFWLDPNTKGGALVLMVTLFAVPYLGYQFLVQVLDYDEIDAGINVGMGFTVLSTLAWMSTYLFRVATKDMTYVSFVVVADAYEAMRWIGSSFSINEHTLSLRAPNAHNLTCFTPSNITFAGQAIERL